MAQNTKKVAAKSSVAGKSAASGKVSNGSKLVAGSGKSSALISKKSGASAKVGAGKLVNGAKAAAPGKGVAKVATSKLVAGKPITGKPVTGKPMAGKAMANGKSAGKSVVASKSIVAGGKTVPTNNSKSVMNGKVSAKVQTKPTSLKATQLKSTQLKSTQEKSTQLKSTQVKSTQVKAAPVKETPTVKLNGAAEKPATNGKAAPVAIARPVMAKQGLVTGRQPAGSPPRLVVATASPDVLEFSTNDKVVYPAHGVGEVDSIQVRKVSGSEQRFYMITIIESGMKIMVPVGQAKTVGLRRVVDEKTVEKVYDILRDRKVQLDTQTWNRRYREYSQKIKTGSVLEIARVIRDLSVLKSDKELSFGERRMLDTAQGLLVKEISIAKASPEDSVKEELQQLCQVTF